MTLIFTNSDFWIESFNVARALIAVGATTTINLTLTRPGKFVGCAISTDGNITAIEAANVECLTTRTDNNELVYGDQLTQIRGVRTNNHVAGVTFGFHLIVFMRK